MNIYIIIPAHNEERFINLTLKSLSKQSYLPKKVVVVNDNSSDNTAMFVSESIKKYKWLSLINITSNDQHLPGSKIINAFYKGLETLDTHYDVICKFDADLIFPENYLETLKDYYLKDPKLGMVGGHCYVEKNGDWYLERSTGKNHVRGALKSYRKTCFESIGQLKRSAGWDTVDELLALYYNWSYMADPNLKVKHLKPTGSLYNTSFNKTQGEIFYKLKLGLPISFFRAVLIAYRKKSISYFFSILAGYFSAKKNQLDVLVDEEQGKFIRKHLSPF